MKSLTYISLVLVAAGIVAGCSDVGFKSVPKLSCSDIARDQNTTCENKPNFVQVTFTFGVGDVDILFVDDNSGSMFMEQQKMANAFPNFLSTLSNLFYQIAIVTTDVSASPGNAAPRPANGNGAFQDGKFLVFQDEQKVSSGLTMIDRSTPNAESLFRGTIQRQESLDCDKSGFLAAACPSSDERGIYAANLAIKRGNKKFFRPGAHLAVVVLSDEDERGQGGVKVGDPQLEADDLPVSLLTSLSEFYPTKSLSVHSIVTNDEACRKLQTQTSQYGGKPTLGFIGLQYMALSSPTADLLSVGNLLNGVVGSICADNYVSQMGNVGLNIRDNTDNAPKQLACTPDPSEMKVVTNPTGYENQIQYSIDSQNRIVFSNLPTGVKVSFSYECPRY
jgi:hypothetical protein